MEIDERIAAISEYMLGYLYDGTNILVNVRFPRDWDPLTELIFNELGVNVGPIKNAAIGDYHFWGPKEAGSNLIFDAVDFVIKFNKTAQQKIKLLDEKYKELQNIFKENSIETLQTLEFKYRVISETPLVANVGNPKIETPTQPAEKQNKKRKE